MKVVLIVLGILFLLLVAGVVGFCALIQSIGGDMQPLAHEVLKRLDAGEYQSIYDDATDEFRSTVPFEQLAAFGDLRKRALGDYQGITRMSGVHFSTSSETGELGDITVEVDYASGETRATFKFRKVADVWKLVGFDVEIPEGRVPKADPAALEPLARELVGLWTEKKLVALYDRFEPELKDNWEASAFQEQMLGLSNALGPLEALTLESQEQGDDGYTVLELHAKFEQGEKTVRMRFLERNGRWGVFGLFVENR